MATALNGAATPSTPNRADIIAGLESLADAAGDVEAAPAETAETSTGEVAADAVATDKPTAASPAEPAPDAETQKRLSVIQRAEERQRAALKQEREQALAEIKAAREEFERQQSEWKPKLESFERLKARAKYEPAAVLAELGLTDPEDFEFASKDAFLRTKAAAADPKSKAELARATKEREQADDLGTLKREIQQLKQQLTTREQRAQHEQAVNAYLDEAVKAANDETPLLRTLAEKNPQRARAELERVAYELAEQNGAPVTAAEVALEFENRRRADLEAFGVDVTAKKKPAPAPAQTTRPTTVLSPTAPTGATPIPKKQTREEVVAQTLRDLEAGNVPAE